MLIISIVPEGQQESKQTLRLSECAQSARIRTRHVEVSTVCKYLTGLTTTVIVTESDIYSIEILHWAQNRERQINHNRAPLLLSITNGSEIVSDVNIIGLLYSIVLNDYHAHSDTMYYTT